MNILRHPAVIIVLILLVFLLFGSRRLPDFARSVGQSMKIFKKEVRELKEDDKAAEPAAATDGGTPTAAGTTTTPADAPSSPVTGQSDPKPQG